MNNIFTATKTIEWNWLRRLFSEKRSNGLP